MTAPLTPEREQEIRELTAGIKHFTAPWHVDYEMTDGYWPVSYSTDNPLAGLIAQVPDYGVSAAFFIAESATFVPELLAELDRLRAELAAKPAEVLAEAADAIVAENDRVLWATKPGRHWASDLLRRMTAKATTGGAA